MHLLVCYLNELQNARCKDRDSSKYNFYFEYLLKERQKYIAQSERAFLDYCINIQSTYYSLYVPTHFFLSDDRLEENLCMILL